MGALMLADKQSLEKLSCLQDLPQRIHHHRQQQHRQLHGSQQESEARDEALGQGDSQAADLPGDAEVALLYAMLHLTACIQSSYLVEVQRCRVFWL